MRRNMLESLRFFLAISAGLVGVVVFHTLAGRIFRELYAVQPALDTDRVQVLVLIFLAGMFGAFVAAILAGPLVRWVLIAFFLIAVVIDIEAVRGDFASQPHWFNITVLATIPLQIVAGAGLAFLLKCAARRPSA